MDNDDSDKLKTLFNQGTQPAPESDDELPSDSPRNGKVARLPAALRDTVNLMLYDSAPYAAIIDKLAALGRPGFNPSNISRWKKGGYLEWLHRHHQAQAICTSAKANLQLLKELTPEEQDSLHRVLELAFADHLLAGLSRFDPGGYHPETSARILALLGSTLSRHLRERTRYERLQLAVRKSQNPRPNEHRSEKTTTANGAIGRKPPQTTAKVACPEPILPLLARPSGSVPEEPFP